MAFNPFTKDERPTMAAFNEKLKEAYQSVSPEKLASYETAGSYEWIAPDWANGKEYKIGVLIIGGGASGGAGVNTTSTGSYYVPGGASGFSTSIVDVITPGEKFPLVVGAGGKSATHTTGGASGTAGGSSAFNGVTASGGSSSSRASTVVTLTTMTNGASPTRCASDSASSLSGFWGGGIITINNSDDVYGRPDQCINPFTGERILGSGGSAYSNTSTTDTAVAGAGGKDPLTGLGGGDAAVAVDGGTAQAEDASLPGCGGGAANVASSGGRAISGAGADGAVYIYFLGVADE